MSHPFLVKDIAQQAGVSVATVDRVLHGRSGVRQHTIRRIDQAIREPFENCFLNEHPLNGNTRLAAVGKCSSDKSGDSIIDGCAREHNHRILPAQFERIGDESLRCRDRDMRSSHRAASESNVVDMLNKLGTDIASAVNNSE